MTERFLAFINSARTKRNFFLLVMWGSVALGLFTVREVLLPFMLAAGLAYLIDPLVVAVCKKEIRGRSLPRWGGVLAVYFGAFAVIWVTAVFVVPQLYKEGARLVREGTAIAESIDNQKIREWSVAVEEFSRRTRLPIKIETQLHPAALDADTVRLPDDVESDDTLLTVNLAVIAKGAVDEALGLIREQTTQIVGQVQGLVARIVGAFFSFFLVLMITAFLSVSTQQINAFLFSLVPTEDKKNFDAFLIRVGRGLSGVIRGQLTICLVNGALTLLGLLVLKVKFAFILALLASVFSLIPIFGSILSTIPIVLVALASGVFTALLSLVWILLIHFAEANFLNPKIMGDASKIHPVIIVLALVTGEHFYGLVGALFAVPLASFLLTVFRSVQMRAEEYDAMVKSESIPSVFVPVRARPPRIWRDL